MARNHAGMVTADCNVLHNPSYFVVFSLLFYPLVNDFQADRIDTGGAGPTDANKGMAIREVIYLCYFSVHSRKRVIC